MSWSKNVYSSHVQEVGYDTDNGDLIIKWKSGKTSAYASVPEELAVQLSVAGSVGEMLNAEVKPYYGHRYVS